MEDSFGRHRVGLVSTPFETQLNLPLTVWRTALHFKLGHRRVCEYGLISFQVTI